MSEEYFKELKIYFDHHLRLSKIRMDELKGKRREGKRRK